MITSVQIAKLIAEHAKAECAAASALVRETERSKILMTLIDSFVLAGSKLVADAAFDANDHYYRNERGDWHWDHAKSAAIERENRLTFEEGFVRSIHKRIAALSTDSAASPEVE